MYRIAPTILFLALVALTACKQPTTEPARPSPTPTTQTSTTPATTASPHPNQVTVSLGKISAEAGKLNPRIAEAYSPGKVTLERNAMGPPAGFPGAAEPADEAPAAGMKWVIVLVDLDATQGEFSMALNKIRLVDQSGKPYRLVSFGGSEAGKFADLREYDRYKMVEPPKMMMRSDKPTKQNFLFAVPAKAEGLQFEF